MPMPVRPRPANAGAITGRQQAMQAAPRPSSVRTGFIVFLSRWSVGPVVPVLPEDGSSSNLRIKRILGGISRGHPATYDDRPAGQADRQQRADHPLLRGNRSEEHTSEIQSLMSTS